MSEPVVDPARSAAKSRVAAIILALAGLVGMFLALVGMTGQVRDRHALGANPTIWLALGLIIAVAAAIADTVLGSRADFTTGNAARGASSTVLNRLLPWIIVALTLIGLVIIAVRG